MLEAADTSRMSRGTASPTWLVVSLACAGQFLVVLDVSVVNVALPSMRADLDLSSLLLLGVPPLGEGGERVRHRLRRVHAARRAGR
ncbi:hypothetical protein GCM10011578_000800 [Streptomyces fuscichromogenes]|uniref:MFS transporter n=1 Tax=Streptomyces fuscichromogenes TaxID=1324013 RepID=A0A917UFK2_9ACTN|nr:hypothetical protein GCM10011578_000800 [Streptomyces fuscichromogenes]